MYKHVNALADIIIYAYLKQQLKKPFYESMQDTTKTVIHFL